MRSSLPPPSIVSPAQNVRQNGLSRRASLEELRHRDQPIDRQRDRRLTFSSGPFRASFSSCPSGSCICPYDSSSRRAPFAPGRGRSAHWRGSSTAPLRLYLRRLVNGLRRPLTELRVPPLSGAWYRKRSAGSAWFKSRLVSERTQPGCYKSCSRISFSSSIENRPSSLPRVAAMRASRSASLYGSGRS